MPASGTAPQSHTVPRPHLPAAGHLLSPQAAARVHILLTSQPGSPLSLPSSFWVTPFGPALGHSSCLWGPRPRTVPPGGQPPAFLPSLPLALPGLRDPHCPPGRGWVLSPCRSAASGLGVPLPSPLHPLTPLAPRRRPQRSGLSGGPPSSPSSGTSLTPTCLPPAWRPLVLHARRVRSRGTAGDACCPCHRGGGPLGSLASPSTSTQTSLSPFLAGKEGTVRSHRGLEKLEQPFPGVGKR